MTAKVFENWFIRGRHNVLALHVPLLLWICAAEGNAADLLTCTHKTGAIVYTRTPSVLDEQFTCAGQPIVWPVREFAPTEKLDPTPSRALAGDGCLSTASININSSGYGGNFVVELRRGNRPGSQRLNGGTTANGGSLKFENVCPGNYFYAFGPTDSDSVSITRYFAIRNDAGSYNNQTITVYYAKLTSDGSKRIEQTKKSNL